MTVDPALAAALHIVRLDRDAFDRDTSAGHDIWQTSSIDALLDGEYEGDLTFAELAAHGDFGIGTVQHLDGEMVALDGEFFNITHDGVVHRVAPETCTPFAVLCHFQPGAPIPIDHALTLAELARVVDEMAPPDRPIVAIRVDGAFGPVRLRSVPGQVKPYPPLTRVVAQQREWTIERATGSLVGFRFPDAAQGIDVAGAHLHFLSDDRTVGGHVIDLTVLDGTISLDGSSNLHLEVPAGVRVGDADTTGLKGAIIRSVEGR